MADSLHQTDCWLADQIRKGLRPALNVRPAWFRGLKAICEIAFFVSMKPNCHAAALVAAVDDCLIDLWSNGKLLSLARHNLEHANLFLPLLLSCNQRLTLSASSKADIRRLVSLSLNNTKERLPYRQVDLLHSAWKLTGSKRLLNRMDRIARYGCLRKSANVSAVTPKDDYAITHTIFYLTDFGMRPWPIHLAPIGDVDAILWCLSKRQDNRDNLDLLGEFLLARVYLGTCKTRLATDILSLWSARSQGGIWIGPADITKKLESENMSKQLWPFLCNYHTTLVCREALAAASGGAIDETRQKPEMGTVKIVGHKKRKNDVIIKAYIRLKHGQDGVLSESAFRRPESILHAVEWYLLRRAMLGIYADDSNNLNSLASTDGPKAWSDLRLARIVLSAGVARFGESFFEVHRSHICGYMEGLRTKDLVDLSVDEACILGLIHMHQAQIPVYAAQEMLEYLIYRYMGELEFVGAVQVGVFASLFGNRIASRKLGEFVNSYRARSLPIGYLTVDGNRTKLLADRMHIAVLQYECLKTMRGRGGFPASHLKVGSLAPKGCGASTGKASGAALSGHRRSPVA